MSARDKATKHLSHAQVDRSEAEILCDGTARAMKEAAKKEARKARRQLDRAETDEATEAEWRRGTAEEFLEDTFGKEPKP